MEERKRCCLAMIGCGYQRELRQLLGYDAILSENVLEGMYRLTKAAGASEHHAQDRGPLVPDQVAEA